MSRAAVLRCVGAAVLFGASTPAAGELAGDMGALVLAGLLYLGAGVAVLPAVVADPPSTDALRRDWRPTLLAVVAGGAIGPALLVAGLARTSAASASILLNFELAATVVLAATLFREHLGGRILVASVLVTVAGATLAWEPDAGLDVGAVLVAGACVAWGLDNCVTARIDQLRPEHVVLAKGLGAGAANLLLGVTLAGDAATPSAASVLVALGVGALGYGISIVWWVEGARDLGAARAQVIFATAPFVGAVLAWTVFGEAVTATQALAVVLAAAGVGISLRSAHEHDHDHVDVEHLHEHGHDDGHHDHGSDEAGPAHAHVHRHRPVSHHHPHVPDLHHRHH